MITVKGFAFRVVLLTLPCAMNGQKVPQNIHVGEPERVVGVVHKNVAESSSVASEIISAPGSPFKHGAKIEVRFVFTNLLDKNIEMYGRTLRLEVRDDQGKLPSETDAGCRRHWFSPCYTNKPVAVLPVPPLGAHEKLIGRYDLSMEYDLKPGQYSVVGYECSRGETPECFKTNRIMITVQ